MLRSVVLMLYMRDFQLSEASYSDISRDFVYGVAVVDPG